MDDVKRLGYPAAIIALSALIVKLFQQYIHIPYQTTVITIIIVLALFLFGMSLSFGIQENIGYFDHGVAAAHSAGLYPHRTDCRNVSVFRNRCFLHQYDLYFLRLSVRGLEHLQKADAFLFPACSCVSFLFLLR